MKKNLFLSCLLITFIKVVSPNLLFAQSTFNFDKIEYSASITEYLYVVNDEKEHYSFSDLNGLEFLSLKEIKDENAANIQWVKFTLRKESKVSQFKISIAFADSLEFYYPDINGNYIKKMSGDTFPFEKRDVKVGQVIVFEVPLYSAEQTFYVKITSRSNLSYEARQHTLKSFTVFSDEGFHERFESNRYYQSLFYGALLIMLFYNLFLVIIIKSKSYFYYTLYLSITILFFAFNNGYMLELFMQDYPSLDIYLRFLLTPLLLIFFLLFSLGFLNAKQYLPKFQKVLYFLIAILSLSIVTMLSGHWMLGRSINIYLAVFVFLLVLIAGVKVYLRGFKPALYFLIANFLVLIGGVVFALEKISFVVHNPFTQYSIQISIVFEMALFSIGLADRINLIEKKLAEEILEHEKLEKKAVIEKRRLIEQKNQELETKVKERTLEVVEQKEKIEKQNIKMTDSIQYASRIQNAVLGPTAHIESRFSQVPNNEAFVMFKPKDIVSGDFYWYTEVGNIFKTDENNNTVALPQYRIAIAADCTGHGVPGAFMTMLGSSLLEEIVIDHGMINPSEILLELDKKVTSTMTRNEDYSTSDGMDMSILVFDTENNEVKFSGAKNPVFRIRNGEIIKVKGSLFPIGSLQYGYNKQYELHTLDAEPGDMFYIFSDGFQDQFGGSKFMKYTVGKFKKLLLNIADKTIQEQKETLENEFLSWKKNYTQTDDVLLMGFRV